MKLGKKVKLVLLAGVLAVVSMVVIVVNGGTYTIRYDLAGILGAEDSGTRDSNAEDSNATAEDLYAAIEDLSITIEDENIVECVEKKVENGTLEVKIKSKAEGRTFIDVQDARGEFSTMSVVYVHKLGIITVGDYMGDSNGSIVIPIAVIIILVYLLFLLITAYRRSVRENIYQYKNIAYLGIIIFTVFAMAGQIMMLFGRGGLINTVADILGTFCSVAQALLPVVFIVSILVTISNIILVKREGFSLKNVLGIGLGVCLCFMTALPELMYGMLYSAEWVDIHNQGEIAAYLYNFVETVIFITIAYVECVLIGTIVIGVKAARHMPRFDKDAILILGCRIRDDGTLTNILRARVDRAIEFSEIQKAATGKEVMFVPSGGKGGDEVMAEAEAMKNYLVEKGVSLARILVEDKSKNTYENIKFSSRMVRAKVPGAKMAFSTTNYHVFRAGWIATEQGMRIEGIGARTKTYFWVNAFIREFVATIFTERKRHLAVIGGIILAAGVMAGMMYVNGSR